MKTRFAFTLMEILVVILITLVLAAIALPVYASARKSAVKTSCTANIRQAASALAMYIEDAGYYPAGILLGKKIRATSPITAYAKSPTFVFRCPHDHAGGRVGRPLEDRREPRSYAETWFLWEGDQGLESWQKLEALDTNPILFRCNFHDDRVRDQLKSDAHWSRYGWVLSGPSLSVRKDGSVKWDRRGLVSLKRGRIDMKLLFWKGATEESCPPSICDGTEPVEGIRED